MTIDALKIPPTIMRLVRAHMEAKSFQAGIEADSDLVEAGLTSFDMVQIVLAIEKEYALKFPDEELNPDNFKDVASIARVTHEVMCR